VAIRIQLRRDTATNWTSYNPILRAGEVGIETDTQRLKIGDGTSTWSSRPYVNVLPSELTELSQDAVNQALTAGNGITKVYDDANNTLTISVDTSVIANKNYVDSAVAGVLDSAPELLNTLNELAAAIGDDPSFFATVATNLSNHQADTTNIHGIADTSKLITDDGSQTLTNKTLTSPVLNGVPTAPTAVAGTNTTQIATTQFVKTAVDNLIDGAPGVLDTLNEIAAAVNDDPAFFTNVATNLASHENDTTNIHGIANTAKLVTDDGEQTLTNKDISGATNTLTNIPNAALVNPSITINGYEIFLGGSASYSTDNINEGTVNHYFTPERAQDAVAQAIASGTHSNIIIDYDDANNRFSFMAENGVADSTTDDLDEGINNLYFTDQRAIDAVGGSATPDNDPLTVVKRDAFGNFSANLIDANLIGNVTGQVSDISNHNTNDLAEGLNLYFTEQRTKSAVADQLKAGEGVDLSYDFNNQDLTVSVEFASDTNPGIALFNSNDFDVDPVTAEVSIVAETIKDIAGGIVVDGEGINTEYNNVSKTLTISGEDASTTNKGIASFDSTDFVVTNGNVELNTEGVADIVGGMISSNSESGINVTFDNINNKLDFNVNDPVITISGDVSGSATMTNLGNVEISTTIQPNSVSLGADTTGNYVQAISGTVNEIEVTGSGSESANVTIGLPDTVHIADDLQVGGDATIIGNLTVQGTTTTITSQNLAITDKLIELGNTATPTDAASDGGGIFLHGTTDKHLAWYDATDAWTSSENFDLHTGKVYMINETEVLSSDELFGINKNNLGKFTSKISSSWVGTDVLRVGELGLESDTGNFKLGDGVQTWAALPYINVTPSDLSNTVDDYIPVADRNSLDGVAAINSSGDVLSLNGFVANSDATGEPSGSYGLIVKRGNQPDALLLWNETLDKWTYSGDGGTNNYAIASEPHVASAITSHKNVTQNVHGISDTANLVYQADLSSVEAQLIADYTDYSDISIETHRADTTNIHGIPDTSLIVYLDDLQTAISGLDSSLSQDIVDLALSSSQALSSHEADTTNVHGIADTSQLTTFTYVDGEIADQIDSHNLDTMGVHGIADTALLATDSDVSAAANQAESNANTYTDGEILSLSATLNQEILDAKNDAIDHANYEIGQEVIARNQAIATSVNNHNNSTTSVHGIPDTSVLATHSYVTSEISTHNLDTTNVHGIANTADLATKTYADNSATTAANSAQGAAETFATGAVSTHNLDTTDVHGISNTANLVYTNDARLSDTRTPTNGSVTTEKIANGAVTNDKLGSDIAITSIVGLEDAIASKANATDAVIFDSATLPTNTTIGNVSSTEIGYLDGVTSSIQDQINSKLSSTIAASTYAPISSPALTGTPTAPTALANTNTTQIATTEFVTGAITSLINGAPGALNTLNELAAALGNDSSYATTITNALSLKAPLASPTFTGTVILPNSTITTNMLADGSVTAIKIASGTITNTEISASAAIDQSKISGLATALNLKANLSSPTFTGSVTVPTPTADTHAATKGYVDSKAQDIIPLDNINSQFDGSRSRFQPKYDNQILSITNPLRLLISINGIIQILGNPDNHWLSPIPFDGFYVDSDGYLNFGEPVPKGSVFDGRVMNGPTVNSVEKYQYPFRPIDILLGA